MAIVYRLQTVLGGLAGGAGLTTFHFLASGGSGQEAQDSVDAFWSAVDVAMTNNISITPTNELVAFEDTTGEISSFTPVSGVGHQGDDVSARLPPTTQGLIRWGTDGVVAGRRVQGRTFVPGPSEANSTTTGVPEAAYVTALTAGITALLASATSSPCIWSRPVEADPEADPPVEGRLGSSHLITGGAVWSQWAVLRGRRDG
jgi:hypothetical protein